VTVFIDLDRSEKPVVFVTPGRGKETVVKFRAFLAEHGGSPSRIAEVVCDMSGAFIAAVGESFENAAVTVDWFHVVQLFTKAVDEVRRGRSQAEHAAQGAALGSPQAGRRSPHRSSGRGFGRTRGFRPVHRDCLAHQGEAALGSPSAIGSGRALAAHQLPASCH